MHIPDGTIGADEVENYCREYESQIKQAGGIDLQLLGIGRTGHIGFNEPGAQRDSATRLVELNAVTRKDAAGDFEGIANVPTLAITMGVRTILESKRIRLLAFGEHKSAIVQRTVEGEVTDQVPATFLQGHSDVVFIVDSNVMQIQ